MEMYCSTPKLLSGQAIKGCTPDAYRDILYHPLRWTTHSVIGQHYGAGERYGARSLLFLAPTATTRP